MSETANHARGGEFATSRRGRITADELRFIHARAQAGVPVSQIAKMIGRAVQDVQAASPIVLPRAAYADPKVLVIRKASSRKPYAAPERPPLTPIARRIVADVAKRHGLTTEQLMKPTARHRIAHPRQEAFFALIRQGYSASQIGRWFGRDHATVLYGACAHRNRSGR